MNDLYSHALFSRYFHATNDEMYQFLINVDLVTPYSAVIRHLFYCSWMLFRCQFTDDYIWGSC